MRLIVTTALIRRGFSRAHQRIRLLSLGAAVMLVVGLIPLWAAAPASASNCVTAANPIVCENALPGDPMSDWYSEYSYGDISGFTDQISYQIGDTVNFKIESPVSYNIEILRLGWYGGDGARIMDGSPTQTFPAKTQPTCDNNSSTGDVDCGNWSTTYSWTVPSDAVSGVYIADLSQTDNDGLMTVPFVVRDDTSTSDIVVQTDDETWEAYNMWTGADLYQGDGPAPDGRDYAVSYNRPMDPGGDNGIFGSEYPMIQWLERNGYNVSYLSGVDVSTDGSLLLNHKVFMSSGHDEYWTAGQYANVMAARKAGVDLAFFSGNEVFWKTQLEPSIDGTNTPNRTLVTYKETKMEFNPPDGITNPSGVWTGSWMDPAGASGGGDKPENQLTGSMFTVNGYRSDSITVPAADAELPIWANTSVASLQPGQVTTFPAGTLGYEWDSDVLNATRPSGEIDLSSTTVPITNDTFLLDYGNTYGNGTATNSLIMYRDPTSGALVFGTGTVQWSWGLETTHTNDELNANPPVDPDMQQATVNVLAEMGVQPGTLQSNLDSGTLSTDTTGPSVSITSPSAGTTVPVQSPVTIAGTAADSHGGVVARVEVSSDGGQTWQPATWGTDAANVSWSYTWTPTAEGSTTLQIRAENGNAYVGPVQSLKLNVGAAQCPCSVFTASSAPVTVDSGDGNAVTLGVRVTPTQGGYITGIRFYKAPANTGTHIGTLWSSTGTQLAAGTFTNETASGWQQLNFAQPVPVKANTTYVASYFAPNGHYSEDAQYFASQNAGTDPIMAPQSTGSSPNGLYAYGSSSTFPSNSYENTNYWVDVVMTTGGVSTSPPTVTTQFPAPDQTGVPINDPVTVTFSTQIDPSTLTFSLTDSTGNLVPASVTYDNSTDTATLTPDASLNLDGEYTASVSAADTFGNTMTQPVTWSFTTSTTEPSPSCPCSIWSSSAAPANLQAHDYSSVELGTVFESSVAGQVTGVRFYKTANDTSDSHTGTLWTSTGTQLATGSFTNETASGWQTLTFSSPVTIQANTPYVISVHFANGEYPYDLNYFGSSYTNYPLTASEGVYAYGSSTLFPTSSWDASNYWVDVVFATSSSPQNPDAGPNEPGQ
jgi:N,N-dimethylformamidase beta subunit-like, C-terminal/Domain of unknown function (DUF4082)/Bacterial Ig-like domain/Bacterial Ig domain